MNSEENNELQIKKLERMERIYADEKKHETVAVRDDDDQDVCFTARKFFKWALLVIWLACAFTLVTGGDFTLPAAGILVTAGIYSALCVTKFLNEKKTGDAVIAVIIAVVTIALGIILLTGNNPY